MASWLDEDGKTKDGLPPNIYANMLLQEKRANGQDGAIIRCHHDGCENDYKSIYWRSISTHLKILFLRDGLILVLLIILHTVLVVEQGTFKI